MPTAFSEFCKDLLVCPACRQPLLMPSDPNATHLLCSGCARRYPFQDGIPVLIEGSAILPPSSEQ